MLHQCKMSNHPRPNRSGGSSGTQLFTTDTMLFTKDNEVSWMDVYSSDCCCPAEVEISQQGEALHYRPGLLSMAGSKKPRRITDTDELLDLMELKCVCYTFLIRQKNSNGRLLVTEAFFSVLLDKNNVFEDFSQFVLSFGWKKREYDIGPPPCRFEIDIDSLCMEFRNFECAYGMRYVELNNHGNGKEPWSIRQWALYHKFRDGIETWIVISASDAMERKIAEHTLQSKATDIKSRNPFEAHLSLVIISLCNWRWYIKSLVERATEQSTRVIAANAGRGNLSSLIDFEINFEDRQILQILEEKALDLITIFESTSDTITTILQEYDYICGGNMTVGSDRVKSKLTDSLREVDLYQKKAHTLYKRIQGTASLLSNLLDYENAKIAQGNGDSLRVLAQESREENSTMRALTERATRDAAAVKVITLITIIYLPTSVVSGFFSTQFVHQSADGKSLMVTRNAWILAAVAFPLTIATFIIWYCWVRFPWQRWWNGAFPSRYVPRNEKMPSANEETAMRSATSIGNPMFRQSIVNGARNSLTHHGLNTGLEMSTCRT
ncbi:hypothetical protein VTL71DRAFT_8101 [Oculimacula yallundae]|uniref:CorA-like transporter domain-containing protein n=1 Tax=Oculimacula yallundae TaxID=86028 RepID=A0ABR4CWY4_9HELO